MPCTLPMEPGTSRRFSGGGAATNEARPPKRNERPMTKMLAVLCALAALLHSTPLFAQAESKPPLDRVYREIGGDSLHAYGFLPRGHGKNDSTNAILLFHGGGWSSGAAEWTFTAAQRFADAGLVAVAIEYRLSTGEVTPIEALADAC